MPDTLTPLAEEREAMRRYRALQRAQAAERKLDEQNRRQREKDARARRKWHAEEQRLHDLLTAAYETKDQAKIVAARKTWAGHYNLYPGSGS